MGDGQSDPEARQECRSDDMLTHDGAMRYLSMAWDDEITEAEMHQLAAHLEHCPECSQAAEKMQLFLRKLGRLLAEIPREGKPR